MEDVTALDSIARNFFHGEIDESLVFPFPSFTPEQMATAKEMSSAVDKFCADNINGEKFDREAVIPKEVLQGLAELGLFGLAVPEEFGGLQLDYSLYARVFSEIAGIDGATATMLGAHQSIGYRALLNEGTVEQKKKWLPRLASGEIVAAFCLTEPGSGSDAYSIKTKAKSNNDGTYTINGQKLWITNGGLANFYSVFCKTEHDVAGEKVEKITCFIVEGGSNGLSFGEKEDKMGIRASETRAVYFDNVVVPVTNMIGEEGKGFKIAMNVLNSGRLSLGSACVGAMKKIIELATAQSKGRKQFDKPICEFGLIQDKLVDMAVRCYTTESMVYLTTGSMVKGLTDYSLETAICKVYGSESLWIVIDKAMQIAAGNGYMREYPYERLMRDSRINLIFEGTNEILRCFLALAGIQGPSEDLKEIGKIAADIPNALQDPIKSLGVLTGFAKGRIAKLMATKVLTKYNPNLEKEADFFSMMLNGFAIQVENTLIKHGRKIIEYELPQGRLADMAIALYATIAVISRTTSILDSDTVSEEEKNYVLNLAKVSCENSKKTFDCTLSLMKDNHDKAVGDLARYIVEKDGHGIDIVNY